MRPLGTPIKMHVVDLNSYDTHCLPVHWIECRLLFPTAKVLEMKFMSMCARLHHIWLALTSSWWSLWIFFLICSKSNPLSRDPTRKRITGQIDHIGLSIVLVEAQQTSFRQGSYIIERHCIWIFFPHWIEIVCRLSSPAEVFHSTDVYHFPLPFIELLSVTLFAEFRYGRREGWWKLVANIPRVSS